MDNSPSYGLRYYCHDNAYWDRCRLAEASESSDYQSSSLKQQLAQHWKLLDLLEKIKERHGIPYHQYQIASVTQGDLIVVDERAEARVYSEHFVPRASVLNPRNEGTVPDTWRSNSGNYYVVNCVTVLENDQVGWATPSPSFSRRFPQAVGQPWSTLQREIAFLEAVHDQGIDLLRELCFPVTATPEEQLTVSFLASATLAGNFRRQVRVGWKAVDLICQASDSTWVLEVEQRLSWAAFGQVLGYAWLYAPSHPTETIARGIVCGSSDDTIEAICRAPEFAVTVFLATDQGFVRRGFVPSVA